MAENVSEGFDNSARIERSAVRSLNTHTASLERSAAQRLTSESVVTRNSALGVTHTATLEMHESAAGVLFGDYVRAENTSVGVLVAPRVSGNVKAMISPPVAFAFGFGYFFARQLFAIASRERRKQTAED